MFKKQLRILFFIVLFLWRSFVSASGYGMIGDGVYTLEKCSLFHYNDIPMLDTDDEIIFEPGDIVALLKFFEDPREFYVSVDQAHFSTKLKQLTHLMEFVSKIVYQLEIEIKAEQVSTWYGPRTYHMLNNTDFHLFDGELHHLKGEPFFTFRA
ncbi:MAG: hypothetical protein K1000chlam4_00475 [Chlamydiae bacterium]|nr:hypothetical protein [Chlamydiota bacterium]